MHGVVVLPKLHRLREILPIESHLQTIFGVKGKCITETENTVKAVMRSVDRESLKGFGVAGVDTLLMDESG
jgi:RNase P/RNase MRP subunit p29